MDSVLPRCGRWGHRGWTVVRDGFYGRPPRRRQRYRCHEPADPGNFHRFTPPVIRLEAVERHCLECENPLMAGQGPNAARRYDFAAREIATALVAVAGGSTYSQAAFTARRAVAGTEPETITHRNVQPGEVGPSGEPSRHGTLVASWVETYTPVVLGADLSPATEVLLLDSTPFWRRAGAGRMVPAFTVLAAYGYPTADAAGRLLLARAYRTGDASAWADLLARVPGLPAVVVSDRDQAIRAGIRARWPGPGASNQPEIVYCRWHLADRLRKALVKDLKPYVTGDPKKHPLWLRAERAFDTDWDWREFYRIAWRSLLAFDPENQELPASIRWLNDNDLLVRTQIARRRDRVGVESNAPLELHLNWLRQHLAARAQGLRNEPRTNEMLRLIVAGRNGHADERAWAEKIRAFLASRNGAAPVQRQLAGAGGL